MIFITSVNPRKILILSAVSPEETQEAGNGEDLVMSISGTFPRQSQVGPTEYYSGDMLSPIDEYSCYKREPIVTV